MGKKKSRPPVEAGEELREGKRARGEEVHEQDKATVARQAAISAAADRYEQARANTDPCSRSNKLRTDANKLYELLKDGMAPVLMTSRLSQVECEYSKALSAATTPLERCSAAKNLAKLAERTLRLTCLDGPTALKLQADALRYFVMALAAGAECQTVPWLEDVAESAAARVQTALDWEVSRLATAKPELLKDWPGREAVLSRLHAALPPDAGSSGQSMHVAALKASVSLSLGKNIFVEALKIQDAADKEQEWRRGLEIVGRVQPLFAAAAQDAARAGDTALAQEAESMMDAASICEAICRSVQARHQGTKMLKCVLEDSDDMDLDGLWMAVDKFKEAIFYARALDLESEARSHVALGNVYLNVLRMTDRGLAHYKQVMELAVAMLPRVVYSTDWYLEARQAVLKVQDDLEAEEERLAAMERRPVLEELAEELKALAAAAEKGAHVLLRHVYEKHPPTGQQPTKLSKEAVSGDKIKDTLRKAVIAYHPDKQVNQPRKWQVLASEITKELNRKYTCMKL